MFAPYSGNFFIMIYLDFAAATKLCKLCLVPGEAIELENMFGGIRRNVEFKSGN